MVNLISILVMVFGLICSLIQNFLMYVDVFREVYIAKKNTVIIAQAQTVMQYNFKSLNFLKPLLKYIFRSWKNICLIFLAKAFLRKSRTHKNAIMKPTSLLKIVTLYLQCIQWSFLGKPAKEKKCFFGFSKGGGVMFESKLVKELFSSVHVWTLFRKRGVALFLAFWESFMLKF